MTTYAVIRKSDGQEVYRYSHTEPVEWNGMEFATHDHIAQVEVTPEGVIENAANPAEWRIDVGSFFDRFGAAKLGILASPDATIQAFILDVSVRKYIDLLGRHDEIAGALAYVAAQGHTIDIPAILDVKPTINEVWNG